MYIEDKEKKLIWFKNLEVQKKKKSQVVSRGTREVTHLLLVCAFLTFPSHTGLQLHTPTTRSCFSAFAPPAPSFGNSPPEGICKPCALYFKVLFQGHLLFEAFPGDFIFQPPCAHPCPTLTLIFFITVIFFPYLVFSLFFLNKCHMHFIIPVLFQRL